MDIHASASERTILDDNRGDSSGTSDISKTKDETEVSSERSVSASYSERSVSPHSSLMDHENKVCHHTVHDGTGCSSTTDSCETMKQDNVNSPVSDRDVKSSSTLNGSQDMCQGGTRNSSTFRSYEALITDLELIDSHDFQDEKIEKFYRSYETYLKSNDRQRRYLGQEVDTKTLVETSSSNTFRNNEHKKGQGSQLMQPFSESNGLDRNPRGGYNKDLDQRTIQSFPPRPPFTTDNDNVSSVSISQMQRPRVVVPTQQHTRSSYYPQERMFLPPSTCPHPQESSRNQFMESNYRVQDVGRGRTINGPHGSNSGNDLVARLSTTEREQLEEKMLRIAMEASMTETNQIQDDSMRQHEYQPRHRSSNNSGINTMTTQWSSAFPAPPPAAGPRLMYTRAANNRPHTTDPETAIRLAELAKEQEMLAIAIQQSLRESSAESDSRTEIPSAPPTAVSLWQLSNHCNDQVLTRTHTKAWTEESNCAPVRGPSADASQDSDQEEQRMLERAIQESIQELERLNNTPSTRRRTDVSRQMGSMHPAHDSTRRKIRTNDGEFSEDDYYESRFGPSLALSPAKSEGTASTTILSPSNSEGSSVSPAINRLVSMEHHARYHHPTVATTMRSSTPSDYSSAAARPSVVHVPCPPKTHPLERDNL